MAIALGFISHHGMGEPEQGRQGKLRDTGHSAIFPGALGKCSGSGILGIGKGKEGAERDTSVHRRLRHVLVRGPTMGRNAAGVKQDTRLCCHLLYHKAGDKTRFDSCVSGDPG